MAWTLEIDPLKRLVVLELEGELTQEDLIEWNEALAAHPDFCADYRQLAIVDDNIVSSVTASFLRGYAQGRSLFSKSSKRAFVISADVSFEMARMFELSKNDEAGTIVVFRKLEDALAWLDLEWDGS